MPLETSVPFSLGLSEIIDGPCVVVQTLPFATVVPPSVARWGDELVGGEFVEYLAAAYAPESVFKRTECGTYHVHLGIVIVLGSHLVIEGFIEIGAAAECQERECGGRDMIGKFHIPKFF